MQQCLGSRRHHRSRSVRHSTFFARLYRAMYWSPYFQPTGICSSSTTPPRRFAVNQLHIHLRLPIPRALVPETDSVLYQQCPSTPWRVKVCPHLLALCSVVISSNRSCNRHCRVSIQLPCVTEILRLILDFFQYTFEHMNGAWIIRRHWTPHQHASQWTKPSKHWLMRCSSRHGQVKRRTSGSSTPVRRLIALVPITIDSTLSIY